MRSSYDNSIFPNSNIYANNINSSRSFFGKSSKLENLQNLYFHLNPYSNSTSIKSNQQLKELQQSQNQTEPDSLDRKYGKPNVNNYKRFHFKVEEVKKGKKGFSAQSPYSPVARDNPNLAFYSVGDLATLHPLTYQRIQSTKNYITSNNMKNNMRIQMLEEKMRKMEEKNEGLQVLNNIFFDSLKDNISQSLKRKAFLKRHLKDIEYLKAINIEEYNNKVEYLNKLVEENNIDFDNYDDNGEPLSGVQNLEGKIEATKAEIGTLLTKNTMRNDANINVLRKDVEDVRKELEDKLIEYSTANNKNFEILQDYLLREEQDRKEERKRKEEEERFKREKILNNLIPDKKDKFQIKAKKKEKIKKKPIKIGVGESEETGGEVSSETNRNIDVIDKMLLDSMTVSISESEIKTKKTSTNEEEDDENEEKEIDLRSGSSKTNKDSKSKGKKSLWKLLQTETETIEEENDTVEGDENVIIGSYKSKFKSDRPEIQSKRSKKSKKFRISKDEEPVEESDGKEKGIEGSYNRTDFYSNHPEIEKKSKRSKNSRKFVLSKDNKAKGTNKELKENEENIFSSENKKSNTKSKKAKTEDKYKPSEEKEENENEENKDDNPVENEESEDSSSSVVYTESFKLTNKTGEKAKPLVNLKDIKEGEEIYLVSDISNIKSSSNGDKKSKKSKKSRKSKKSKKKSKKSKPIKEENEEDED